MPDAPVIPAAAPAEVTPPPVAGESTVSDPETTEPGAEALGDAGKKALDAMKAKWKAAEDRARAAESSAAAAQAKADGKEAEYAKEQERRNVESAALAKANERILKAEVRAAAAGKLADPADALRYLDLGQFEVGSDGEVDGAAISAAIAGLLSSKSYLAAQGGTATVFESPGAHRAASPDQLTRDDLRRMKPNEIEAAREAGRLERLMTTGA